MSRSKASHPEGSLPPDLASIVFDTVDVPIWVADAEGRIRYINGAFARFTGCESGEVVGQPLWDAVGGGEDAPVVKAAFGRIMAEHDPHRLEFQISADGGHRKLVAWSTTAVHDDHDRVRCVIGIGMDASGQNDVTVKMTEEEIRYRVLVESMTEGLVVDGSDGLMAFVNDQFCRMSGYSQGELLGRSLSEFLDPANRSILEAQNMRRARGGTEPYELSMIRKDGSVLDVYISPQQHVDATGRITGSFGVITDLTVFKLLKKERSLLATAIEQSAEAVVITDVEGTIQYVNPAFEDISGYSRSEAIGENPRILKSGKHDQAFYSDLWETISGGEVWTGVITNRAKDRSLYEEEASISPVRGDDGRIVAYVGVKRDVTEERRLSQKLAHAQRLEAIGHLAGGIAHNFNNLLMTISGSTELLRLRLPEGARDGEELAIIEKTVAQAADVAHRLLYIARQQVLETEVLDVHDLLVREVEMLSRVLPESITIDLIPASGLPAIRGDRDQVAQVLSSLVIHAGSSMPEGGVVTIAASELTPDAFLLAAHPDACEGRYVRLSISDNGVGMDADTRDRIFDPFYTPSPDTEASGLDLAAVYGIVSQHKGMIEVESVPGAGSRFDIYLPATNETLPKASPGPAKTAEGGGETILVVEDEDGVRHTLVEMLSALGYTVFEAENGRVALEVIGREGGAVDLVLSDVAMPEMGGRELLEKVRALRPEIPFVFSSGFSGRDFIERMSDQRDLYFISKPYSTVRLATTLRKALTTGGSAD